MLIEQHARLDKVQIDLLYEKRVALSLAVDQPHQLLRRGLPGQRLQHRANTFVGQPAQAYPLYQVSAFKLADDPRQRMVYIDLDVPVGAEHQHRHPGQQWRQILGEQHGGLIGPVQILKDQEQRLALRCAAHELAETVPHIAARQLGRQLHGGGMSGNTRLSAGAIRAISAATSPSDCRNASGLRGLLVACSMIPTYGKYGGAPLISTQCPVSTRIPRA